ncbi:hypothetical protein CFC21_026830 [Triticum aestivum]|uniref:Uncharacterized protein n=2 Tax=Triticum aestivum TaxID=4565 RepID=A0A3B6CJK2_WHEAT|nr:uncharacterized protein LOC123039772 [Triticum aestivum]KAF7012663.1 hypothetical protein CFC21_026830 [Triticum aestivum]
MGNVLESVVSGFTKVLAGLLSKPIDFLSGKACSTVCGPTWDIFCYVENFCVASLAKTAVTLFLLYLVLLFFYVVYKLGICRCVGHVISKILCSCLSCCSSACKHGCARICNKMRSIKHARQRRPRRRRPRHDDDIEQGHFSSSDSDSEPPEDTAGRHRRHAAARHGNSEGSSVSRRRVYLERSLRPRNHRVTVGVSRRSDAVIKEGKEPRVSHRHDGSHRELHHHHGIKVTHTSRFARKASARSRSTLRA